LARVQRKLENHISFDFPSEIGVLGRTFVQQPNSEQAETRHNHAEERPVS